MATVLHRAARLSRPSRLDSAVAVCATHGSAVAQLRCRCRLNTRRRGSFHRSSLRRSLRLRRPSPRQRPLPLRSYVPPSRAMYALRCSARVSQPRSWDSAIIRYFPLAPHLGQRSAGPTPVHSHPWLRLCAIRRLRPAHRSQRSRTRWSRLGAWRRALRRRRPRRQRYQPGPPAVPVAHAHAMYSQSSPTSAGRTASAPCRCSFRIRSCAPLAHRRRLRSTWVRCGTLSSACVPHPRCQRTHTCIPVAARRANPAPKTAYSTALLYPGRSAPTLLGSADRPAAAASARRRTD